MRGLLQPRGDVDGVSGRESFGRPSYDFSRIDADARLDAELGQGVSHLHRSPAGPERVILVHLGDAEDGHDRVADELLHRSPVRLDDPLHTLEVAGEQGAERLRVGRLAQRGRAGYVAENDGDDLALLSRGGCGRERRCAVRTEGEFALALAPTLRANEHVSRLDRCWVHGNAASLIRLSRRYRG